MAKRGKNYLDASKAFDNQALFEPTEAPWYSKR